MPGKTCSKILLIWLLFGCQLAVGQVPFSRTGQVFLVIQNPNELVDFTVSPGSNTLNFNTLAPTPLTGLDAIGFCKTDNLLYGISTFNNHLTQVDASGSVQDIGPLPLDNSLFYLAGDVSPEGQFLYSIGSVPGAADVHIAITDLQTPNFNTSFVQLNGSWQLMDIAFDPFTAVLFGYDRLSRQIVTINPNSGVVTPLSVIDLENEIEGLFFDAFGDFHAYGRSVFGIVDALFIINKVTGDEKRLATGPVFQVLDAASCPFSLELKNAVEPATTLPCTDLTFTYTLANGSGETMQNVSFEHQLPAGFYLSAVTQNPLGVQVDTVSEPGTIRFNDFDLPPGNKKIIVKLLVSDVPAGTHSGQAVLKNLPPLYGLESRSDNPATGGYEDSTRVQINRFDADTLAYNWFICHGETLVLDGSEFGSTVIWNTGATSPQIEVSQGGYYSIDVATRCQTFEVSHEVTSASCPYTISLAHVFEPDTIFPCSDVIFRYILNNASGEVRQHVALVDTLPPSFSFVEILQSPPGSSLKPDLPPNVFCIENLTLQEGKDTLDILVHVGDIAPGNQYNRALLYNLPQVMGPIRESDYPRTVLNDATPLHIKGTFSDTLFFDSVVCANAVLQLDASDLGQSFEWQDGTTKPTFLVKTPGQYQLTLFDGCEPATVFWNIGEGTPIEIMLDETDSIHQGQSLEIVPFIWNQGDSLDLFWSDPLGATLSCLYCTSPVAAPLETVAYTFVANNEVCADTAVFKLFVNDTRRIYAPNAFSPNSDGINDFFFLQSPDFGKILRLTIIDRWGNEVFNSTNSNLNDASSGWDGFFKSRAASQGTYFWKAEIEFIDGKINGFSGATTVIR